MKITLRWTVRPSSAGRPLGDGYLVATGFDAWGISNGTVAGMILADLATGKENGWLELFDATRVKPIAGASQFVKGNVEVAAHLITGYLSRKPKSFDELAPGDAAIMEIDGRTSAPLKTSRAMFMPSPPSARIWAA
jgi:hypothetical protein